MIWFGKFKYVLFQAFGFSSNRSTFSQSKVGEGETLGLVMLASDETHLTNHYGDKYMHAVYMSCGNIDKNVRSKESSNCWVMVAQIPVIDFEEKEHQGILSQRLYHICLDIVTEKLKECSNNPVPMCDANGDLHLVRTILLAHLARSSRTACNCLCYEEHVPAFLGGFKDLGCGRRKPDRTGKHTLRDIESTTREVESLRVPGVPFDELSLYKAKASARGLNGIHEHFWRDWKFACPSQFLAPDALHQWHKFFEEHILKWTKSIIGDNAEIDHRYMALQKLVGRRHFSRGFTSFKQHTCRESRELQSSFIAIISGIKGISPGILRAYRALLDFYYLAQYETHSTKTLLRLQQALRRFHANKKYIAATGVRDGPQMRGKFNIKKIELMHHVYRLILLLGTTPQYSTDQSELLHIPMAKVPYKATNKKDYAPQICRFLDRREKIYLFVLYIEWKKNALAQTPATTSSQAPSTSQFLSTVSSLQPPTPQIPSTVSSQPSNLRSKQRSVCSFC